ncbi:MAG: TRAP transporter substrate-binding protein [Deltaproteobacteria bacterium]|nr:TRAP transporter substrate-binding protein [Deltaproteobacteria bacterium]MDZ4345771.1 TRAP transporter substrate-binding protein [Candidatus Binatia bacterium]
MKRFIMAIFLLALLAHSSQSLRAQTITLRLGHVGFPGSLFAITTDEYAKRANAALAGKVDIKVFHSSQLGSDEQMMRGIKVGAPEMFLPSTVMSTAEQKFGVFEMPYIIVSRAHMKKVVESKQVQGALFDGLPAKGMRILGVWENGFRHITNNVRPIVKPADLKGIKLRVPGGVWRVKMFKDYGANPSPMPLAEVYSALQSGVMDAQENPFPQIASAKFQEVQKFLSLSGHVYTPAYLVVGEEAWAKLPKDVQGTLSKIAWDMGDFARSEGERLDKELMSKLVPPMKVNEVDKEAFIKGSATVYQEFGKEIPGGSDLIKLVQSLR